MSPKEIDKKYYDQITPEVIAAVHSKADGGKITCEVARKIASDAGVPNPVVGAACNQEKIRVHNCGLGCF